MARRPLIVTVLTAATALVATLAIVPLTQANAARQPDLATPAGLAPEMVAELARTFHISKDAAVARLTREARFTHTEQALRAQLGIHFGGAYLDSDATTLTVGVTRAADFARVRALGGTPKLVRHNETQLNALAQRLDRSAALTPRGVPGWYPDVHHNTVTVLHHPGALDTARAWVQQSGVDGVRYEQSTETPQTMIDIIGGNAYYIGSGSRCSVGFSVNGGFVTAGHCGRTGATTTQPSGSFAGSSFPVSHNSRRYKSTWWSTGAEPGAPSSWAVWEDQGSC